MITFAKGTLVSFVIVLLACEQKLKLDGDDVQDNASAQANSGREEVVLASVEGDGSTVGVFDAQSGKTQRLTAPDSSSVGGAGAAFPPGALAIDTDITIEEGENLVNEDFAGSLGFDHDKFDPASKAVLVSSSNQVDPQEPFTINIPLNEEFALTVAEDETALDRLLMFYKRVKYSDGGKVSVGLMPREDLQVDDGLVSVDSSFYGVFQAVLAKEIIEAAAEQITDAIIENAAGEVIESGEPTPSFNLVIGFAGATPPSPSQSETPKIKGVGSSAVETVIIYSDPDCTSAIGSGTKAEFQGEGIEAAVEKNGFSFIFARAFGANNSQSLCTNFTTYISDSKAPTAVSNVSDNAVYCDDGDATTTITWSAASDDGSGLDRYEVSAGTSAGSTNLAPWITAGLATTAKVSGINLADGLTYYVNIKAIDKVGNSSMASTDGCLVDESAPDEPEIDDFTVNADGTAQASFSASDPDSGLSALEFSLGTSSGDTSVISWTALSSPTATSHNISFIPSFDVADEYFFNLRATNNAGVVGDYATASGLAGLSIRFDGVDDYIEAGNPGRIDITGAISIQTWVRVDTSPPATSWYLTFKGDTGNGIGWTTGVDRDQKPEVSANGRYLLGNTVMTLGTWYHIVTTMDGNTARIYVNGTEDNNQTVAGSWHPTSVGDSLKIGAGYRASNPAPHTDNEFDGSIDEVAIWNAVLSADEIAELYAKGPGFNLAQPSNSTDYDSSSASALQYWLPMGETWNGSVLTDQSGESPAQTATLGNGLSDSDFEAEFATP